MKWRIAILLIWLQVFYFLVYKLDPYFNSKEYYQKFSEIENAKLNNEMYNFNNYQFYDMQSQDDSKKPKKK